MKTTTMKFGLPLGIILGLFSATPAWAGTAPVEATAPPDAGVAPGPVQVQGGTSEINFVQPFVYDSVLQSTESVVGTNATAPFALADQIIPDATIFAENTLPSTLVTPESIAIDVADLIAEETPITIQIASGSLEVTPTGEATTLAVIQNSLTQTQRFIGAPTEVNQQVATVTALTAAGATPEAAEAGSSISSVGVQAPDVVALILGFQALVGDFTTASLAPTSLQAQMPVLIASAELPSGLLMAAQQGRRVDVEQLNAVIAAYNQLIQDCPAEALPQLSSNPEFQAIGDALRQLRAALQQG